MFCKYLDKKEDRETKMNKEDFEKKQKEKKIAKTKECSTTTKKTKQKE